MTTLEGFSEHGPASAASLGLCLHKHNLFGSSSLSSCTHLTDTRKESYVVTALAQSQLKQEGSVDIHSSPASATPTMSSMMKQHAGERVIFVTDSGALRHEERTVGSLCST